MDLHSPAPASGAGSILTLLTAAAAAVEHSVDVALAPYGLDQRSLALLEQLEHRSLSAPELALASGSPGSDVKTALSGLEARGYLERSGTATARPTALALSDSGRRAVADARRAAARANERASAGLPDLRLQLAALIQALHPAGSSGKVHAAEAE